MPGLATRRRSIFQLSYLRRINALLQPIRRLKNVSSHALSAISVAFIINGLVVSPMQAVANDATNISAPDKEVIDSAMQGVVAIYMASTDANNKPVGTGFFITTDGYVLTASHVVDVQTSEFKGSTFKLGVKDKPQLDAQIIARNYDLDVALLKVVNASDAALLSEVHPLPLKLDSTNINLSVLGNPLGDQPALFISTPVSVANPDRNGLEVVNENSRQGIQRRSGH